MTLSNHDFRSLMNCLSYFSSELKKKIRCLMWQTCWLNPILTFAETMLPLSLKPTKCVAWLECFAYSLLDFHQKWDSLNCRPLVSMLSSMEVLSIWYCNMDVEWWLTGCLSEAQGKESRISKEDLWKSVSLLSKVEIPWTLCMRKQIRRELDYHKLA